MSIQRTASGRIPVLLGSALLGLGTASWAAVPVEESVAEPRAGYQRSNVAQQQNAAGARNSGGADTGRLSELFYEMQVLQQEVQDLRGMVEEQNYRLERLARDQQEQYLDLDRRIQALRGGGGGEAASPPSGERTEPAEPPGGTGGSFDGSSSAPASEREAYARAFELMKQRQFDASAQAFNSLVAEYPNGAYTPNAFYWLGELYLAQEENERARQSFAQVVNLYPDHQKVADALYKLGVVYHRLGDVERAREYLNRVRSEYPDSSAAGLAQTYLAEL